ncbi:hypothetical protein VNO80_25368 [Phaseolus coccineus]|uniref:Uncharacterized protein n=1 Tax=Phaseolus coccineus TaxID=3886 RepID=A0AAN9LUK4_PHACN
MHVFDLTVYKESADDVVSATNPHRADYGFHAWPVQSEAILKVDNQFESYLCIFDICRRLQRVLVLALRCGGGGRFCKKRFSYVVFGCVVPKKISTTALIVL